MRNVNKKITIFFLSLLFVVVLAAGAFAAIDDAFKPIEGILKGVMNLLGAGDNPMMWVKLSMIVVFFSILYATSAVIPNIKDNKNVRITICVALSIGSIVILKDSFLAGLLAGYFAFGLAVLIGFTFLGTVYLCYTTFDSTALKGGGRTFNALRYLLPAFILAAFVGLMTQLAEAATTGILTSAVTAAGAGISGLSMPDWLKTLFEIIVGFAQLGIVVLIVGAFIVLVGFSVGVGKKVADLTSSEMSKVRKAHGQLAALVDLARRVHAGNGAGFGTFKNQSVRYRDQYLYRATAVLKAKGIDVTPLEADVNAAVTHCQNKAWGTVSASFQADVVNRLTGALAILDGYI